MKEDIEIKGDTRYVNSLEEKDRNFEILEVCEDEKLDAKVDLEWELIAALEELSIERKNKRLSKKLNEYGDQLEDLCIQIQKVEKPQACIYGESYNKYDEELVRLKDQLEATQAKEEALRLHIERCNKCEEIASKVVQDLKLQV